MTHRSVFGRGDGSWLPGGDPWFPAFVVALAVFSVSLLVSSVVVIRSFDSRTGNASPRVPDAGAGAAVVSSAPTQEAAGGADQARKPNEGAGGHSEPPVVTRTPFVAVPPAPGAGAMNIVQDDALEAAVRTVLGDSSDHYGIVAKRLSDGHGLVINGGASFYAASTFKLAVLMEAERRISTGTLSLSDSVHLTDEDVAEDLGTLQDVPVAADGTVSVGDALYWMITVSDNSTAVAMLHLLGGSNIDATLASLGLTATSLNTTDLPTDAQDMARLMEALYRGDGLTPSARDHAVGLLLQQTVRGGIPQGVPGGVVVGNKTGTWDGATHDVAFVDGPQGPYIIVVLSDEGGWKPIADVSKAVYEILSKP